MSTPIKNSAEEQAKLQYATIVERMNVVDNGDSGKSEAVIDTLREEALDVCVRAGDWSPLDTALKATEYRILLCWGGPAVQVTGRLDEHNEPETARVEFQDWGTGWTTYEDTDEAVLIEFARCFWFGE